MIQKNPYVGIVLAAIASVLIPIAFKPIEIDGKKYFNGGYRDNIPQKYFEGTEKEPDIEDVSDLQEKD